MHHLEKYNLVFLRLNFSFKIGSWLSKVIELFFAKIGFFYKVRLLLLPVRYYFFLLTALDEEEKVKMILKSAFFPFKGVLDAFVGIVVVNEITPK